MRKHTQPISPDGPEPAIDPGNGHEDSQRFGGNRPMDRLTLFVLKLVEPFAHLGTLGVGWSR